MNQGSSIRSRGRMDHHPSRFIDNDQVVIFKDDIKWDLFTDQITRHSRRDMYYYLRPCFKRLPGLFCRQVINKNKPIIDQPLQTCARELRQTSYKKFIKPFTLFFSIRKFLNALTHDFSLVIVEDCSLLFFIC